LVRNVVDEDSELVTAEAGDDVGVAEHALKTGADLLEEHIADVVAEGVVDLLEAIEIDQHHGDLVAIPLG